MLRSPLFKKYTSQNPDMPRWKFTTLALVGVSLFLVILPFIYTGVFSRYQADDYCFSRELTNYGFFGAQSHWYDTTSNRFSTMPVVGMLEPLGVLGMQLLPGILIMGLLLGVYGLLKAIRDWRNGKQSLLEIFSLAGLFTYFLVYTAPNRFQSFFWRSGSVTYTLPLVLLVYLLWMMFFFFRSREKKLISWWQMAITAGLFFINGGFSETVAAMQVGMFLLGIGITFWRVKSGKQKSNLLSLQISALVGLLAAMLLMILSPANAARMASMPTPPSMFTLIVLSLRFGLGFVYQTITSYPLPVIALGVFTFSLAAIKDWSGFDAKRWSWLLWVIPVFVYGVIVCCTAPSAYGESAYAEPRALITARWILTLGEGAWFYLLGVMYSSIRAKNIKFNKTGSQRNFAFIMVILAFYLFSGAMQVLAEIPSVRARADDWDTRAEFIVAERNAGRLDVEVKALDSYGRIRELSDNPKLWVNRCAAVYYGVDSIIAK